MDPQLSTIFARWLDLLQAKISLFPDTLAVERPKTQTNLRRNTSTHERNSIALLKRSIITPIKAQLSRVKQLYIYVAHLLSTLIIDFNTDKYTLLQKAQYIIAVCTIIGIVFGLPSKVYRYFLGTDPLVQLNNSGFSFDTVSYFRAIKTGRPDIVLLFLKLGMSPYTLEEDSDDQRYRTALSVAIASHVPNICPMIEMFSKHGMDITSQRASGSFSNDTLMDEALGNYNEAAVKCLKQKKYFIHLQVYQTYLAYRATVIRTLITRPKDTRMGSVFADCESAIFYIFGRPEAFEGEGVTSHRYQDAAQRICFSGRFTVSSFQQEYHLELQSLLDSDLKMLKALAP
jgi:hypothetical protein